MCVSDKMGEKAKAKFFVQSISIDNQGFNTNGVVEIGESFIRFCVSLPKSSTQIEVHINGEHIQTVCFNHWNERGNIVLFIDADVARTTFSALGLSGNNTFNTQMMAYWNLSTFGRILFGVEGIHRDVRDAIVNLNENIQVSFECDLYRKGCGLHPIMENKEQKKSSASNEIGETHLEETATSMQIDVDADQVEMAALIVTSSEENINNQDESVQLMDTTDVDFQGKSSTLMKHVTSNTDMEAYFNQISTWNVEDSDHQRISLCEKDLECLQPSKDLNDNVINAYLQLILAEKRQKGNTPKFQLLDVFFLKALSRDINMKRSFSIITNKYSINDGLWEEIIDKKVKMLKKSKIFESDFLVIPICHDKHWFMIIVCHLSKLRDMSCKVLIFDSFRNYVDYDEHLNVLLHFIIGSYIVAEKPRGELDKFMEDLNGNIKPPLPVAQQTNVNDCGLYLIEYFERFLDNPDVNQDWSALIDERVMQHKRVQVKMVLEKMLKKSSTQ